MLFIEDRVIQFVPVWSEQRFDLPKYLYWGCCEHDFFAIWLFNPKHCISKQKSIEVGFYCEITTLFFFSTAF